MADIPEENKTDAGMPEMPPMVKALKYGVIGVGVVIVLALVFLVAVIIDRANRLGQEDASAEVHQYDLAVPPGSEVSAVDLDGNRLAVTVSGAEPQIIIIDLKTGSIVSRVRLP